MDGGDADKQLRKVCSAQYSQTVSQRKPYPTKKHPVPSDGLHEYVCIEHFLHKTLFIYITVQYDTTLLVGRALEFILCPWEDPSRHLGHTGQQVQNDT